MSRYLFTASSPDIPPVHTYTVHDVQMAANEIVLAMDGRISRADAVLSAKAVFHSLGMVAKR